MHLANATRTRLGSREKGGGRWLGGVGLGVPRGSRGARRAGGSPGHWLLLLPVAPSVLARPSLDLESGRDGVPHLRAVLGRMVGTPTWKERAREGGRRGESERRKGGKKQGAVGVEKAARADLRPGRAAPSF